jgi:imidazole glycerol-phosphate synthase subunit HisH
MPIVIIDCDIGNLGSIHHSVELCGGDAIVSRNPEDLKTASAIILPGVGSFGDGMANLHRLGWVNILRQEVLENHIPLLGICLGMQLLAESGAEGKAPDEAPTLGLGLIKGKVVKLIAKDHSEKIPHVGWNEVHQKTNHWIFDSIADHKDFYFVHSYHFVADNKEDVIATTPYCGEVVSAVAHNAISGVQFHPEKSQIVGFQLLKNFIQRC